LNVRIAEVSGLQSRHYKQVTSKVVIKNSLRVYFGWQISDFGENAK